VNTSEQSETMNKLIVKNVFNNTYHGTTTCNAGSLNDLKTIDELDRLSKIFSENKGFKPIFKREYNNKTFYQITGQTKYKMEKGEFYEVSFVILKNNTTNEYKLKFYNIRKHVIFNENDFTIVSI
jgi:hypothetical protein